MNKPKQSSIAKNRIGITKPFTIAIVAVLIIIGLIWEIYYQQVKPQCTTMGNNSYGKNDGFNNKEIVSLAQSLGAKSPVTACWGGLNNAISIDGPDAAIRIEDADISKLSKAECPARPQSDTSNAGWVRVALDDFGKHDRITSYYSPEGSKCDGGGKVNVILVGNDTMNKNVIYIVFYGG